MVLRQWKLQYQKKIMNQKIFKISLKIICNNLLFLQVFLTIQKIMYINNTNNFHKQKKLINKEKKIIIKLSKILINLI